MVFLNCKIAAVFDGVVFFSQARFFPQYSKLMRGESCTHFWKCSVIECIIFNLIIEFSFCLIFIIWRQFRRPTKLNYTFGKYEPIYFKGRRGF